MIGARKWRENKKQLIRWPELALLGLCLVSLHFQCDFLAPITVLLPIQILFWVNGTVRAKVVQLQTSDLRFYYLLLSWAAGTISEKRFRATKHHGIAFMSDKAHFIRENKQRTHFNLASYSLVNIHGDHSG